ncbi:hypothetical protein OG604_09015 [Streptomyces sp. NBC_01231]|nr:hypothetical protein OG604_09015 [Streptomyces sp. NBC_01231]
MSARHALQHLRAHRLRTALGATAVGAVLAVGAGAMVAQAGTDSSRTAPTPVMSKAPAKPVPTKVTSLVPVPVPTVTEPAEGTRPSPVPSPTRAEPTREASKAPVPVPSEVTPKPAPTKWTSPAPVPRHR